MIAKHNNPSLTHPDSPRARNTPEPIPSNACDRKLRLLVTIASFGDKNLGHLKNVIRTYRGMSIKVDVVVVSNEPKDLGLEVKVVVGLPTRNPWSLPFAHKSIFAQNVERYDLFAYSEDDIAITEANIQAFLRVTPELAPNEIAGYLRYEVDKLGSWSLPEVHGSFHWHPDSVRRRGSHTVAEFSNEHAAFYLLNQTQLKRVIASGGFLRGPCEGRYDMLCTAATDPYTNCGFRKVICICALEDFLVHHLPNRYLGQLGLPLPSFKVQIQTLIDICNGAHPASTLCELESKLPRGQWSKNYYETPSDEVLAFVPVGAKTVLSIGCGWGETEARLMHRGAAVTAVPLDSVIAAAAERRGIKVVRGTLDQCLLKLEERTFDCVLITNLLHLLPNPEYLLQRCCRLVGDVGTLVISGPNFHSLPVWIKRVLNKNGVRQLRSFAESGITTLGLDQIALHLKRGDLHVVSTQWFDPPPRRVAVNLRRWLGRFAAENWILQARR